MEAARDDDQAGDYAYATGVHLVLNIPAKRVVRADVYIDGAIDAEATQWIAGRFEDVCRPARA